MMKRAVRVLLGMLGAVSVLLAAAPARAAEAGQTTVTVSLGMFDEAGRKLAAEANDVVTKKAEDFRRNKSYLAGWAKAKIIPSGSVSYLDAKPSHAAGGGAVTLYFKLHARVKIDVKVGKGPFSGTRKVWAVGTDQIVCVDVIPSVEKGRLIINTAPSIEWYSWTWEREAKESHAKDFRDFIAKEVTKQLRSHATQSIDVQKLLGGKARSAAIVKSVTIRDKDVRVEFGSPGTGRAIDAASSTAKEPGTFTVYEHVNYGGVSHTLDLRFYRENTIYDCPPGFNDKLSSLRANLAPGVEVILFQHAKGGGRKYSIRGNSKDSNTHDDKFGDCLTTWKWRRR